MEKMRPELVLLKRPDEMARPPRWTYTITRPKQYSRLLKHSVRNGTDFMMPTFSRISARKPTARRRLQGGVS